MMTPLKRINRIADLTAEAQAAQVVGLDYASLQQLEAMREAARNEGGAAGIGVGIGAGMGLGQTMAQAFPVNQTVPGQPANTTLSKLEQLKNMADAQLITAEEYAAKKQQLLDNF